MGIYRTRWFVRWARKEGLRDESLYQAVREMSEGLFEANLGGNLFKKRIARPGQGKRGGFRTIVATTLRDRCFSCMALPRTNATTSTETRKLR